MRSRRFAAESGRGAGLGRHVVFGPVGGGLAAEVQTVRIEAGEAGAKKLYTPNSLDLKVGTPYVLELVNIGKLRHEFTAAKFFPTVVFRKGEGAAGNLKRLPGGEAEVGAGKQMDLYVTPTKAGEFIIICEIPGHREAGMEATITVTK